MSPDFSIVIPCHNQGRYLTDAIRSIRAQSGVSVEIIVIDDGSSDAETAAFFSTPSEPGLVCVRQPQQGLSAARNAGIRVASADYIAVLDADDRMGAGFLFTAKDVLDKNPQVTLVGGLAEFFGAKKGPANFPPFAWPRMLYDNCIHASIAFRKSDWAAVGGYCTEMPFAEDWDFHLSLLERGDYHALPFVTLHYRRHEANMTSSYNDFPEKLDRMYAMLVSRHSALFSKHSLSLIQELAQERYRFQAMMRTPHLTLCRKILRFLGLWRY